MRPISVPRTLPVDTDASGRNFGREELENLRRVIESGTLTCTKGTAVREFERLFAERYGSPFARALNSGSAAVQAAVAAVDPEPGDEVITTGITDMGAIAAILYQAAVPVFADVDPDSCNVTAATIEARISERTRAIIVTHLFGNPCEMDPIVNLASSRRIPVIEDAAQAYYATYNGRRVGTIGEFGCFSLQQGKHMSTGEGGIVLTRLNEFERHIRLFIDKGWNYGEKDQDHHFLAPNLRMSELQGAVALAQLEKVENVVRARQASASRLNRLIGRVNGIRIPVIASGASHAYWRYPLMVDPNVIHGGADGLGRLLKEKGIGCAPHYIQKPAFMCRMFTEAKTFGKSCFPLRLSGGESTRRYTLEQYPGTAKALADLCLLPWNEKYTPADVDYIAESILEAAGKLS